MAKELGYKVGHLKFHYKLLRTYMDRGLWELENDDDVLTICILIPPSRLIEIYLEVIKHVGFEDDFEVENNNKCRNECRDLVSIGDYKIESNDETYVDNSEEESSEDDEIGRELRVITLGS